MANRSDIWYHFVKVDENNRHKGKCRYCSALIAMTGGATSNLRRHLAKIHPMVNLDRRGQPEPTRHEARSSSSSLDESHRELQQLSQELRNASDDPPPAVPLSSSTPRPLPTSTDQSASTPTLSPAISTPSPQLQQITQSSISRFVNIIKPIPLNKSRQIEMCIRDRHLCLFS